MINIIKYEILKKKKAIMLILGIAAALEVFLLVNTSRGSFSYVGYLFLLALALFIAHIIGVITFYSRDLKSKEGYMIYMTPNSGFKITLAKSLAAILEGLGIAVLVGGLLAVNVVLLGGFTDGTGTFTYNMGPVPVFYALGWLLYIISAIFTSITVVRTVFNGMKFGGIITFLTFTSLTSFMGKFTYLPRAASYEFSDLYTGMSFYIIFVLLTFFTGWLIDNKMDF